MYPPSTTSSMTTLNISFVACSAVTAFPVRSSGIPLQNNAPIRHPLAGHGAAPVIVSIKRAANICLNIRAARHRLSADTGVLVGPFLNQLEMVSRGCAVFDNEISQLPDIVIEHIYPQSVQQEIKLERRQLHNTLAQLSFDKFQFILSGRSSIRRVSAIGMVCACRCCCRCRCI